MLFTYASFEDAEMVKLSPRIAKYFGGSYVASAEKVADQIKFVWGQSPYKNDLDLKIGEDGLELAFITSVLFQKGNADLLPDAKGPLNLLVRLISSAEKNSQIRIEGHTDDNPISSKIYPSNWELSAARAATLVRLFEKAGFSPDRLSALGFGSSRPAFPNRDEKGNAIPLNQAHNRRVIVKVVLPKGEKKNREITPEVQDRPLIQTTY
jgi:flagellar motor protein MotB